jgi:hypothetical protein
MDELHLATSLRPFLASRGLTTRMDIDTLDALQQDTWWAVPETLAADPLAAMIEVAAIGWRPGPPSQVLIDADGRLLRRCLVPVSACERLTGLKALRAQAAGLLGEPPGRSELVGWICDPALLPRRLLLVNRVTTELEGRWVGPQEAAELCTDAIDRLALPACPVR